MLRVINILARLLITVVFVLLMANSDICTNPVFRLTVMGLSLVILIVALINIFKPISAIENINIPLGAYRLIIKNLGNAFLLLMAVVFYYMYQNNFNDLGYFLFCIGIFLLSSCRMKIKKNR